MCGTDCRGDPDRTLEGTVRLGLFENGGIAIPFVGEARWGDRHHRDRGLQPPWATYAALTICCRRPLPLSRSWLGWALRPKGEIGRAFWKQLGLDRLGLARRRVIASFTTYLSTNLSNQDHPTPALLGADWELQWILCPPHPSLPVF